MYIHNTPKYAQAGPPRLDIQSGIYGVRVALSHWLETGRLAGAATGSLRCLSFRMLSSLGCVDDEVVRNGYSAYLGTAMSTLRVAASAAFRYSEWALAVSR